MSKTHQTFSEIIKEEIRRVEGMIEVGEFKDARTVLNSVKKMNEISENDRLRCVLLIGKTFVKQGRFNEAIEAAEEVLFECRQKSNNIIEIDALISLTEALWRVGQLDKSWSYLKQGEEILHSRSEIKEKEAKKREGELSYHKGIIHSRKGELDRAIKALQHSLKIRREFKNNHGIGEALNSIGVVYYYKGMLNQALDVYMQSLKVKEELGNKQQLAIAFNNIGDLFHTQGELEKARTYYQKGLDLFEEIGNKEHIASGLHNIGKFYHLKGQFDSALDYYKKALGIVEELGNELTISENLYYIVQASVDKNDLDLANKHLEYLQKITDKVSNKVIKQRYLTSQALILKTSKRIRSKMKAAELYETVIEDELVNHELTVISMLHSCDLLLFELRSFGEEGEEALSEIKRIAQQLLEIANKQVLHSLLAETYLLKSRLAMIELDFVEAQKYIAQARFIAEERGLKKLANTIKYEMELLPKWEVVLDQKPNLRDITELSQVQDLVDRMIRKKVYRNKKEIKDYVIEAKDLLEEWERLQRFTQN
jgi:tetratricopeptide (TPR) repeat protein